MDTFRITLASTGETMTGIDGSSLSGLGRDEAKRIARDLAQTWARELKGDSLEVVEEADSAAMISLDNGATHARIVDLTEEQAMRAEKALPHDADLYAAAEGEGPMTAWLTRYALACHARYGHWPVIG